jgi:hypothetical protein
MSGCRTSRYVSLGRPGAVVEGAAEATGGDADEAIEGGASALGPGATDVTDVTDVTEAEAAGTCGAGVVAQAPVPNETAASSQAETGSAKKRGACFTWAARAKA